MFDATRSRATSLLPEETASPGDIGAAMQASKSLGLAAGFGSFSTAALGQIGVGGLGGLEDAAKETAQNTAELVSLARNGGLTFG